MEGGVGGGRIEDLLVRGGGLESVLGEPEFMSPLVSGLPSAASLRSSTRQQRRPVGVAS